jgi:hypothetical protein
MAKIQEKYLQQLRDAGLFVSSAYSPTHAWPDGVRVGKPTSTPGNSIPDFETGYIVLGDAPLPPDMDAPMVVLCWSGDLWRVYGQDSAGGMTPADFVNEWSSPDEAIRDILAFYFGDPRRMKAKAQARTVHTTNNSSAQEEGSV